MIWYFALPLRKGFVRPIDLKTEEAMSISDFDSEGLISSLGNDSINPVSQGDGYFEHHAMQLTLYYLSLKSIEDEKNRGLPYREVLRPAILVGITGRIVNTGRHVPRGTSKVRDCHEYRIQMAILSEAPLLVSLYLLDLHLAYFYNAGQKNPFATLHTNTWNTT